MRLVRDDDPRSAEDWQKPNKQLVAAAAAASIEASLLEILLDTTDMPSDYKEDS